MASIRRTKKEIKKHPAGVLWLDHAKYWAADLINLSNEYREISSFFYIFDVNELSRLANVSEQSMKKYIIMT